MLVPSLQNHYLVGGTALSLQLGHRISVDLDLFGHPFDAELVKGELIAKFKSKFSFKDTPAKWAVFCFIEEIKVDIIGYNHPLLQPLDLIDGIRMASLEDIAAMKVNAILGRGTKKDFWDIYELLHHFSIEQVIGFYHQKYSAQILAISIPQAITYFDDAEDSPEPVSLKGQKWETIKQYIQQKVNEFLR